MAFENLKRLTFTQLTSSFKTRDAFRKIPAVLRLGKKEKTQGGFFDYETIVQNYLDKGKASNKFQDNAVIVVEDPTTREVAVCIKDGIFKDTIDDFIENTAGFKAQSKAQMKTKFNNQLSTAASNMPISERYVAVLTAPFEQGSIGSGTDIIAPVTAALRLKEGPGIAYAESGNLRNR